MSGRAIEEDPYRALLSGAMPTSGLQHPPDPGLGARRRWRSFAVRLALRLFGRAAGRHAHRSGSLSLALERAHLPLLPDAYLALVYLGTAGVGVACLGVAALVAVLLQLTQGHLLPATALLLVLLPAPLMLLTYGLFRIYPIHRADVRRRSIDENLPYAVNYAAAMAGAGVEATEILRDLALQPAYGEVAEEAAWIHRDVALFGDNVVSALGRAVARCPSPRMQEFLTGARATIQSGGDLSTYLAGKAEQFMQENRTRQRDFLEGLAVLAESYVTVVIAGPLFLLVMLSVMLMVNGGGTATQAILFALIFLALPASHAVFSSIIRSSAPEA